MNVEVKDAGNKGRGVYATLPIKKGEVILTMDDSILAKDASPEIYAEYKKRDHIDYLPQGEVLLQSPEAYINHSCEPTVFTRTENNVRHLVAIRDIEPTEEVTYDYAINGDYNWGEKCQCGTKSCRGILDNNFWHLPRKKQIEYYPYLDKWFKDKYPKEVQDLERIL